MASPSGDVDGVEVRPQQLDDYAAYLQDKQAFPAEVKQLVAQSDVGNESWGLVGIGLKPWYVSLLNDLQGLLDDMKDGFGSAAEKFAVSAEEYRASEARGEQAFKDLIEKKATPDQYGDQ